MIFKFFNIFILGMIALSISTLISCGGLKSSDIESSLFAEEPFNADDSVGADVPPDIEQPPAPPIIPTNTSCQAEIASDDNDIQVISGVRVKIIADDLFVCDANENWVFYKVLTRDGMENIRIDRVNSNCTATNIVTNKTAVYGRKFAADFESYFQFTDLFSVDHFTTSTLLSPYADTVRKYSVFHQALLKGADFVDNRFDPELAIVHSGLRSIRFSSVAPADHMITAKSLIEKKNLCFGRDDHIWFSGWYFLDKNVPATLVDFENGRFQYGPGIRLIIRQNKYVSMELKWGDKPQYNQTKLAIPLRIWTKIKIHLILSSRKDGLIEVWQNETKIISTKGQTLPTRNSVLNRFQVGITATPRAAELVVDDLRLSNTPH